MKRYVAFIVIAATPWLIVACSNAAVPATQPVTMSADEIAHLRETWVKICLAHPDMINADGRTIQLKCPELFNLLSTYYETVIGQPYMKHELNVVVQDEEGKPIDGVTCQVLGVQLPKRLFGTEPNIDYSHLTINSEVSIPWSADAFAIELDLRKKSYRRTHVAFGTYSPEAMLRYEDATRMLEAGRVLPPAGVGEPVRVVMPPALVWDPNDLHGGDADFPGFTPNRNLWPKTAPAGLTVIARSVASAKMTLTSERGTYVLVDSRGKVLWAIELDVFMPIGFNGNDAFTTWGISGTIDSSDKDPIFPPYEWRLYSTPKPAAGPRQ